MANLKTNGCIPQVGRSKTGKSHTFMKVSLKDSGGGKNSQTQLISENKAPPFENFTLLHIIFEQ
jgi:hypothetical protein